jgi:hypothetical protein
LNILSRTNFGEFVEIFLKGLNPFFNSNQIQISFCSWIFNSNSVGNLNFSPKVHLFLLNLSCSMKSLDYLGFQKCHFHILQVWTGLLFENPLNNWGGLIGPAHLEQCGPLVKTAHANHQHVLQRPNCMCTAETDRLHPISAAPSIAQPPMCAEAIFLIPCTVVGRRKNPFLPLRTPHRLSAHQAAQCITEATAGVTVP